jgi:hypothetical protein
MSAPVGAPMLFRERPTVSGQDIAFDYSSPAELYLSKRGRRHTEYRRFATAAEAIGYAVEELRALRSLTAWMWFSIHRCSRISIRSMNSAIRCCKN